jgi:hypothetical protein
VLACSPFTLETHSFLKSVPKVVLDCFTSIFFCSLSSAPVILDLLPFIYLFFYFLCSLNPSFSLFFSSTFQEVYQLTFQFFYSVFSIFCLVFLISRSTCLFCEYACSLLTKHC